MEIVFIYLLVILDAIADALRDSKKKLAHLIQVLFVAAFFILVFLYEGTTLKDHLSIIALYLVARLFFFDLVYNAVRGVGLLYIGDTSYWDIYTKRILARIKMPVGFWVWIKAVIWLVVSGIIIF